MERTLAVLVLLAALAGCTTAPDASMMSKVELMREAAVVEMGAAGTMSSFTMDMDMTMHMQDARRMDIDATAVGTIHSDDAFSATMDMTNRIDGEALRTHVVMTCREGAFVMRMTMEGESEEMQMPDEPDCWAEDADMAGWLGMMGGYNLPTGPSGYTDVTRDGDTYVATYSMDAPDNGMGSMEVSGTDTFRDGRLVKSTMHLAMEMQMGDQAMESEGDVTIEYHYGARTHSSSWSTA